MVITVAVSMVITVAVSMVITVAMNGIVVRVTALVSSRTRRARRPSPIQ